MPPADLFYATLAGGSFAAGAVAGWMLAAWRTERRTRSALNMMKTAMDSMLNDDARLSARTREIAVLDRRAALDDRARASGL